jgi:hypothetical protein
MFPSDGSLSFEAGSVSRVPRGAARHPAPGFVFPLPRVGVGNKVPP